MRTKKSIRERKADYGTVQKNKHTIDAVLSGISEISLSDKEILNEIIAKRIIEEKRSLIFQDYQESLKDYKKGSVESGDVDDLFDSLKK
ncbi:MAG: hypothetical protein ABIH68_01085 [bacterium]